MVSTESNNFEIHETHNNYTTLQIPHSQSILYGYPQTGWLLNLFRQVFVRHLRRVLGFFFPEFVSAEFGHHKKYNMGGKFATTLVLTSELNKNMAKIDLKRLLKPIRPA